MRPFVNLKKNQPEVFRANRQMVTDLGCFSFVTFELSPGRSSAWGRRTNRPDAWFKCPETKEEGFRYFAPFLKNFGLYLDQAYFQTRHVVGKVPREQRFDGIYTYENKGGVNPHIHMGVFCQAPQDRHQREEKHCFLLRRAHNASSMDGADQLLLRRSSPVPVWHRGPNIVEAIAPNALCHVRSVTADTGMAEYLLKGLTVGDAAEMTDFRFLSDFYSTHSRH